MCSGTEAPIWALKMLQEFFERTQPGRRFLNLSHVFSVEIVPFKQAYIARNAPGAILFNDVRDFIEPENGSAPTAMGAMHTIPGGIDILIAGCSCVDFSTLNTRKIKGYAQSDTTLIRATAEAGYNPDKFDEINGLFNKILDGLENLGESAQTFYSMLTYVRDRRPKIVILENVSGAPWKEAANVWFPFVGYAAGHTKLDTKDFYIPHTRVRGYLIALDSAVFGAEAAEAIIEEWKAIVMDDLPRRASAPVCDWLLPAAHALTERARQDDSEKALGPAVDSDWERSKSIHARVRQEEELGDDKPITKWGSRGAPSYDRMDRGMLRSNPNRVLDCIDIIQLRSEKVGITIGGETYFYDARFKCQIYDVSQNINRNERPPPLGIAGCITPNGIPWMPDQCRLVNGFESLKLQGLPLSYLEFAAETQDQLRDLAGNAMSTTVLGAVFVSLFQAILGQAGSLNAHFAHPLPKAKHEKQRDVSESHLKDYDDFCTSHPQSVWKAEIIELFHRSRRYCFCNGSAKYSTSDFLKCTICSTIRCRWCHGNPCHEFEATERPENFLLMAEVETEVMRRLPSTIRGLSTAFKPKDDLPGWTVAHCPEIFGKLRSTTFHYKSTHVTEVVIVCYAGLNGFELRAKLSEDGITWYLYLDPWSELGKEFRQALDKFESHLGDKYMLLAQPIAKAERFGNGHVVSLEHAEWQLWWFGEAKLTVELNVSDGIVDVASVSSPLPPYINRSLEAVCGKYHHAPHCDAPSNSLHARHDKVHGKKMFLFKDSPKTTNPDKDCYVISKECRALERHEYREVMLKFRPAVDVAKLTTGSHIAFVDGYWGKPNKTSFRRKRKLNILAEAKERLRIPSMKRFVVGPKDPAQQVLAEAQITRQKEGDRYNLIRKYGFQCEGNDDWIAVEKTDLHHLQAFLSYANVKIAALEELEVKFDIAKIESWLRDLRAWRALPMQETCPFAQLPTLKWIKVGGKYKPHYHSDAMVSFENQMKLRLPAFEPRVKVLSHANGMYDLLVQFLVDRKTLGQKAAAYLPTTPDQNARVIAFVEIQRNVVPSQNLQIDSKGADRHKFEPFRNAMKSLQGPDSEEPKLPLIEGTFQAKLSPFQKRSLAWMIEKESEDPQFIEEEIDEELVSDLKLRIVGRARRTVHVRGGILADDVGYGKTVVTLALMHCKQYIPGQPVGDTDGLSKGTYLKATLVVVPPHLVTQWVQQARFFMPMLAREVVTIRNMSDLADDHSWSVLTRLRNARIIVVSNQVFADTSYYLRLAQLAGFPDPPFTNWARSRTPDVGGRAFEEWYKDAVPKARAHLSDLFRLRDQDNLDVNSLEAIWRTIEGQREQLKTEYRAFADDFKQWKEYSGTVESEARATQVFRRPGDMLAQPALTGDARKVKFIHLLELFEFPRVVYDEFSYENFPATLFFATLKAGVRWILSATPPTRNLAAIEAIGKLLNVHIARPIYERLGLPTITKGPVLVEPTNAEMIQHRKFLSDQCVRERHNKGVEFLRAFATANPLDNSIFGSILVFENVIVSEMSNSEFIYYKNTELDLRACGIDLHRMPKDSRSLISDFIDVDQWENNEKTMGMRVLLALSSNGNWTRDEGARDPTLLARQREFQVRSALEIFQILAERAIWLSMRVLRDADDIWGIINPIWRKDLKFCGGYDAWRKMAEAIINRGPDDFIVGYDQKMTNLQNSYPEYKKSGREHVKEFLSRLYEWTETSWYDYFELKPSDVTAMNESEARQLVRDISRDHSTEISKHTKSTAKETLMAIVKDEATLASCRKRHIPSDSVPIPTRRYLQNYKSFTKAHCTSLCKSIGILYDAASKKGDIVKLLEAHDNGTLEVERYASYGNLRASPPGRYPTLKQKVRIRGGDYTLTRSDTSDTSIQLRGAQEQLKYTLKQERIIKALTSDMWIRRCDGCGKSKTKDELYFVCECGHLLCEDHINSESCCGNDYGLDESGSCTTILANTVMKLPDINKPQRELGVQPGIEVAAPCNRISSKSQMIANNIRAVPNGEFVLLFVQFQRQIDELKYTLEKNSIGYTTNTEGGQGLTRLAKDDNLSRFSLQKLKELAIERGCIPEGSDHEAVGFAGILRERIMKFEKEEKNPRCPFTKVRILKLNDPTSAGTNLQYANHVMFACPLLTSLQEEYDAYMKQAKGRCVRYGQLKPVFISHFVTAGTIEVDILELRRQSHILVRPIDAIGGLHPVPAAWFDKINQVAVQGTQIGNMPTRVNSSLTATEIWKAMSEANWLNTVGVEY
ncbi:hypothetical protein F5Y13DRAFT_206216 [Hypoxylon sp. FL1857]|nr:hypothetical protein F5Y13DRAFT_206216 [Hypoxylon sp. FL1857]